MYLSFEITFRLVWYRTPVDINGDKSIHYNQNILTGLYPSNYTIFDPKKIWKGKNCKIHSGTKDKTSNIPH